MAKVRLNQSHDVRRLLARVINQVLSDEIGVATGNCVGQLCNILLKAIEKTDIEERVEKLERLIDNKSEVKNERIKKAS